jgi:hypothetical protein
VVNTAVLRIVLVKSAKTRVLQAGAGLGRAIDLECRSFIG